MKNFGTLLLLPFAAVLLVFLLVYYFLPLALLAQLNYTRRCSREDHSA